MQSDVPLVPGAVVMLHELSYMFTDIPFSCKGALISDNARGHFGYKAP